MASVPKDGKTQSGSFYMVPDYVREAQNGQNTSAFGKSAEKTSYAAVLTPAQKKDQCLPDSPERKVEKTTPEVSVQTTEASKDVPASAFLTYDSPFSIGIAWGSQSVLNLLTSKEERQPPPPISRPHQIEPTTTESSASPRETAPVQSKARTREEYPSLRIHQGRLEAFRSDELDEAGHESNLKAIETLLKDAYRRYESQKNSESYKQQLLQLHLEIGHTMLRRGNLNEAASHFMVLAGYTKATDKNRWSVSAQHCFHLSSYSKVQGTSEKSCAASKYFSRGAVGLAIANAKNLESAFLNQQSRNAIKYSARTNSALSLIDEHRLRYEDAEDQQLLREARVIAEKYAGQSVRERSNPPTGSKRKGTGR
ncbi:hypothetical protein [Endozoicomonas arenosclerae]|uniref:hypothetical protein n=1 Tax=Endozoicomonas arenosclerae TaxID=1633495 RepID=UPI000784BBE2|nr:hypothetical protein [Endozoicomonas arenosclerae]